MVCLLSFLVLFNVSLFNSAGVAQAQDNSVQQENQKFQKALDSLTLSDIYSYYENKISEKKSKKTDPSISSEQRNSIDNEVKTYSEILTQVKSTVTEVNLKDAKTLINSSISKD